MQEGASRGQVLSVSFTCPDKGGRTGREVQAWGACRGVCRHVFGMQLALGGVCRHSSLGAHMEGICRAGLHPDLALSAYLADTVGAVANRRLGRDGRCRHAVWRSCC